MSLRNASKKMSKSDPDARSRILLTDTADEVQLKFRAAKTDATTQLTYDPRGRPEVANLLEILAHFQPPDAVKTPAELAAELAGERLVDVKRLVSDAVNSHLQPIRERYLEIMARGDAYLNGVIEEGRVKAAASAEATMKLVREAVELGA